MRLIWQTLDFTYGKDNLTLFLITTDSPHVTVSAMYKCNVHSYCREILTNSEYFSEYNYWQ